MMEVGNCLNLHQVEMMGKLLKQNTCSWWWIRSYWMCRHVTGSQSWLSWGGSDALCKVACRKTGGKLRTYCLSSPSSGRPQLPKCIFPPLLCEEKCDRANLPYRHDGIPVLAVARPDGYFITFRSDINDSSAHIFACLIK